MSYDISYRRQAFVLKADQTGHYDDLFFLVEEAGSNNCYEIGNRRRARSWMCLASGAMWECLTEVVRCAASCCGGSLCLYGRRHTTPEMYIRAWRRTLAAAAPVADAARMGFTLHPFTRMTEQEAKNGRKHDFDRLSQQTLVPVGQHKDEFTGATAMEWRFSLVVPEQVKLWLEIRAGGRGFHSVEADGPDR